MVKKNPKAKKKELQEKERVDLKKAEKPQDKRSVLDKLAELIINFHNIWQTK